MLVAGEPGAGKSRLLEQLAVRAQAAGFAFQAVRCVPARIPGAESPWLQFIRGCLASRADVAHGESLPACCPRLLLSADPRTDCAPPGDCAPGECLLRLLPGEP